MQCKLGHSVTRAKLANRAEDDRHDAMRPEKVHPCHGRQTSRSEDSFEGVAKAVILLRLYCRRTAGLLDGKTECWVGRRHPLERSYTLACRRGVDGRPASIERMRMQRGVEEEPFTIGCFVTTEKAVHASTAWPQGRRS